MGSKNSSKSINKYMSKSYDRINFVIKKGCKEIIKSHAESQGESVNRFITRAILETMERDLSPCSSSETLLTPEAQNTVQEMIERTGESLQEFVERSISEQSMRDKKAFELGINPVTKTKQVF